MPVIKADAYGHGLLEIASALREERVERLAVGTVAEAVRLRQSGYGGLIMALLGAQTDTDIEAVRAYDIVPLVHDWANLTRVAEAITQMEPEAPTRVAIKCDTGMARLGFRVEDLPAVADFLAAVPVLSPEYIMSHLAAADDPAESEFTEAQARRIHSATQIMRAKFPGILSSLGNSACLLATPQLAGDIGRPGIALYGGNPLFGTSRQDLGKDLLPVMEVAAPILEIHPLEQGGSLGYGRAYVAPSPRRIAVVGIGYADGYRRGPGSGACMCVRGWRVPVVGRVAMQMTCLDITDIPEARPDDLAWVIGGEGEPVTAQDIAMWWGTIPYEVMCLLGKSRFF